MHRHQQHDNACQSAQSRDHSRGFTHKGPVDPVQVFRDHSVDSKLIGIAESQKSSPELPSGKLPFSWVYQL